MTLHLSGYFDNNFGDDYMMKTIIAKLPNTKFIVNENVSKLILEEDNVEISDDITAPVIMITGSGFMLNSYQSIYSELKRTVKGISPGDYCIGCSIEPFKNKLSEYLIKLKLNKFRLIICRDKKSYNWLKSSVKKPEIHCTNDILFSIPDEWIKKPDENSSCLGISVMNLNCEPYVYDYYQKMAEAADYYIESTGDEVILLAFDSGCEDDISACEKVRRCRYRTDAGRIRHSRYS